MRFMSISERRYLVACMAILAIVSLIACGVLWLVHAAKVNEAKARATGLSGVFAEHTDRVFSRIHWMADLAGEAYIENRASPVLLQAELARINKRDEYSLQLSVVDTRGIFVGSNLAGAGGEDLSDRAHIITHLAPGGSGIFISRPLVGRVSKRLSINITRRIYDKSGEWIGIVVVSYDPDELKSFFQRYDAGPNGSIFLAHIDGTLLARSKGEEHTGHNLAGGDLFREHISRGKKRGVIHIASQIDDVKRHVAFEVIEDLPLVVAAGISEDDVGLGTGPLLFAIGCSILLLIGGMLVGGFLIKKYLEQFDETQQARLRASEALSLAKLLQSAFEDAGVYIIVFDDNRNIRFSNKAVQDLMALRRKGGPPDLEWLLGDAFQTSHDWRGSWSRRLTLSDDRSRTLSWTIAPAEWISPDMRVAAGMDRTEIEEAERALYQKARLTTLGEISTGLAHELAQPLTVISFASAMLGNGASSSQKEAIELLRTATKSVACTVDRMKIFGRRDRLGVRSRFMVDESIENIKVLTQADLKLANVGLMINDGGEDCIALGDPVLFEQVLLNLVLNARDAVVESQKTFGGVKEIRVSAGKKDSKWIYVRVADSGPGISEEARGRLFEPFFTTKANGSGLGLALSFGILTEMGGKITSIPTTGGAIFEVLLPSPQGAPIDLNRPVLAEPVAG
jgi:signal transduction histidine kinase